MRIDAYRCDECGRRDDAHEGQMPPGWIIDGMPPQSRAHPDRRRHYCAPKCWRAGEAARAAEQDAQYAKP